MLSAAEGGNGAFLIQRFLRDNFHAIAQSNSHHHVIKLPLNIYHL
jgi:hypothetical protein